MIERDFICCLSAFIVIELVCVGMTFWRWMRKMRQMEKKKKKKETLLLSLFFSFTPSHVIKNIYIQSPFQRESMLRPRALSSERRRVIPQWISGRKAVQKEHTIRSISTKDTVETGVSKTSTTSIFHGSYIKNILSSSVR